ncbi:MAG: hypothetical protein OXH75_17920 [Acidobacteria bacterium]|nr:hypothetical protein [Acidobacteriota bacterium]
MTGAAVASRRVRAALRGTATIEFIFMAPFVLLTVGFIWDVREYVGHRTALAREMYVIAEMIANEVDRNPVPVAVARAEEILARRGSGAVSVAVVVRGDRRDATATAADPECEDDANWCLPMVAYRWPAAAEVDDARWGDDGACRNFDPVFPLPEAGDHFGYSQAVLPDEERPDPTALSPDDLPPSLALRGNGWWVVVDTCLHPDPGLFGGMVLRGLEFFDGFDRAFVVRRRATWGSPHDFGGCLWCRRA